MNEEFKLSQHRILIPEKRGPSKYFYEEKDIKEFIRLLKGKIKNCYECGSNLTVEDIDKLAGDKFEEAKDK